MTTLRLNQDYELFSLFAQLIHSAIKQCTRAQQWTLVEKMSKT